MTVNERSTAIFTATFTNEDGDVVTPNTVTYTLTDKSGNIINSREDISIVPAESVKIVLTGDDTAIYSSDLNRILTIKSDYDSSAGAGLGNNTEYSFTITPLVNVV